MRIRMAGIELDGAPELPLTGRPVPFVSGSEVSQTHMSFGERVIQRQGFLQGRLPFRHRLAGWQESGVRRASSRRWRYPHTPERNSDLSPGRAGNTRSAVFSSSRESLSQ